MKKALLVMLSLAALAEGLWPAQKAPLTGPPPADWRTLAQTGQKLAETSPGKSVWVSPNGRHRAVLSSVGAGLDVECYRVEMGGKLLADNALEVTFSPDSRFLFIATGPHPVVWDLAKGEALRLAIDSGLENLPVWVHSWSADGLTLVLHQQQRFDDGANRVKWTVKLRGREERL